MKNFFEIFSLPTKFSLDHEALEEKYLEFQKQFHPDNASTADIERSIAVNDAYKILINPIRRASHILQLNDIDLEDDSKAPKADQATLLEILELQEQVSEITPEKIHDLQKELSNKEKILLAEVAQKLENQDFAAAAQILIRAKYFDKTLRDLKAKKRN